MHVHLFAYGTLEIPAVMRAVVGIKPPSVEGTLHGYTRFLIKGATFPGVIEMDGGCVTGRVYESLDAAAFARLDAYEEPLYERRSLTVVTATGEAVVAETYVIPPACRAWLWRQPWDKERFVRVHLQAFLAGLEADTEARNERQISGAP